MNIEKLKELEQIISSVYSNVAGIVVQKKGVKEYEKYFNGFAADDAIHVFSVTKSVISALIGIAIEKGHIKSTGQAVLDFFPEYVVKENETAIQNITIEHLLTMTASYKYENEPYEEFFSSENWVEFALDLLGGEEPTGEFRYTAIIGVHILSGILVKATGQPVLDFARENLFSPLEIKVTEHVRFHSEKEQMAWYAISRHRGSWVADPQGIHAASWGLTLTPGDMARIGQLYLNGGVWNGRQILPAAWIAESTREHSRWEPFGLGYGYLWWIFDENDQVYGAMGDGGNVIYVNTAKQLVISIAALFVPDARAEDRLALIKEWIEPVFEDVSLVNER